MKEFQDFHIESTTAELCNFIAHHPSLGEDLSLKIEVHDKTIWKSTSEL